MIVPVTLLLMTVYACAELAVENVPMYEHGVVYERMKNVRLNLGSWTLHTKFNLKDLAFEVESLESLSKFLQKSCHNFHTDHNLNCEIIVKEVDNAVKNLLHTKEIIYATCDSKSKRGAIDAVGNLESFLFGTMSNTDRERIDKDLLNLKSNEDQLLKSLEKQTVAVDSIFELANTSISMFETKMLNFSHMIINYNARVKEENFKNKARNHLFDLITEIELLIDDVTEKTNIFLSLLTTENKPLSYKLYKPTKFLQDLKKIQEFLPKGFEFPIALTMKNIMQFYAISKMSSHLDGCIININVKIPITNKLIYEAYKGTSVPVFKYNKLYVTAIENDVVLKPFNSNVGMIISYMEYMKCTEIQSMKVCPSFHVLQNLTLTDNCNVRTFLNNSKGVCISQPLNLKHQLWIQLNDPNSWVYAVPRKTNLVVMCNDKQMQRVEINMVGRLRITKPCLIKSDEILLHYYPQIHSDIELDIKKIDFQDQPIEMKLLDEKIPETTKNNIFTKFNNKELFDEMVNLKNMNANKLQLLNVEVEKHSFSIWKAIILTIASILLAFLCFKIYKYLRNKLGKGKEEVTSDQPIQPTAPLSVSYINTETTQPKQKIKILGQARF